MDTTDYSDYRNGFFTRRRVYNALLLFVVLVGGTMGVIPRLRHRLWDRCTVLKAALFGDIKPISARVGENLEPFPEEFARPAPPAEPKLPAAVFSLKPSSEPQIARSRIRIRTPEVSGRGGTPPVLLREDTPEDATGDLQMDPSDSAPKYIKGKMEQDAYDMVLKSNKKLAEMVQGGDPLLRFKSWDAAFRGEDVYWVRVIFQNEQKQSVEYIWQVRVSVGEITPLSFNARSLF